MSIFPGYNFSGYTQHSDQRTLTQTSTYVESKTNSDEFCVGALYCNTLIDLTNYSTLTIIYTCDRIRNSGDSSWNYYSFGFNASPLYNHGAEYYPSSFGPTLVGSGQLRDRGTYTKSISIASYSGYRQFMFYLNTADIRITKIELTA